MLRDRDVVVNGYYVRDNGTILRFVSARADGVAQFTAYDQKTGEKKYSSECAVTTMYRWAERKATEEEINRILTWKPPAPKPESLIVGNRTYGYALRNALRSTKG